MGELLTFPGLGLEFRLSRVAFEIGGLSIAWYGIIMAIGFLVGICYVMMRTKEFGVDSDRVIDVLLVSVIGGIIGARLYYVAFSWDEYKDNLIDILKIWHGGIAIYGGLIGAVIVGLLMCRARKVRILPMVDLAAGGVIIGQAIGRWGNFVNIEAFGSNTAMPWGMAGPAVERYLTAHQEQLAAVGVAVDPTMPVHPTFFYESIWCLIGFLLIAFYTKRRRFDGELVLLYGAWYGAGRLFIEGLRTDSLMLGNVRISQAVALLSVVTCVIFWFVVRARIKKATDPEYMKLYVYSEEAELIRKGEFYAKPEKREEGEAADSKTAQAEEPERGEGAVKTKEKPEESAAGKAAGEKQPVDGAAMESAGDEANGGSSFHASLETLNAAQTDPASAGAVALDMLNVARQETPEGPDREDSGEEEKEKPDGDTH